MSKIALILGFVSVALLGCGGGGGGGTAGNGNGNGNGMMPPADPVTRDFTNGDTPTSADRTGDTGNDVFTITGDTTGTDAAMNLILEGTIDGRAGSDEVRLNTGAEVASIAFSDMAPTGGALHLQNIETITLGGGVVNGAIDASAATAGVSFNLNGGMTGALMGGGSDDTFTLAGDMVTDTNDDANVFEAALTVGGVIDGMDHSDNGGDEVQLNAGAMVASIDFTTDPAPTPTAGQLLLQNIETITINGGVVTGNIDASAATAGVTFNLNSETVGGNVGDNRALVTGGSGNDVFNFGAGQQLFLTGGVGRDEIRLNTGAVFDNIRVSEPAGGPGVVDTSDFLFVRDTSDIEIITFDGGMVNTVILMSPNDLTFNLNSGMAGELLRTGSGDDTFILGEAFRFGDDFEEIDGGAGTDTFMLDPDFTPDEASFVNNVLTLTSNGSVILTLTLANIELVLPLFTGSATIGDAPALTFDPATTGEDTFVITNNIVGIGRTHTLDVVIDGGAGQDDFRLDANGVVRNILFSDQPPTGGSGDVHLQNVRRIHINGGMVTGDITGPTTETTQTFILQSGTIDGNVFGDNGIDIFTLHSAITINGYLDGGGGTDTLRYTGATPETVFGTDFPGRGGLDADPDITDNTGDVRNIETHTNAPDIASLSVRNIEGLALSPALNLYGALSDALMQFGQQTAEGFALADLNPQTGRVNQLISKASPFTKGHIWAHKITHAGNGKGSIGLSLTGLTARATSDYDYEMSLTQHGFDAPVVSSQWGKFGLRAVSHTMTGTIETDDAAAQVSGYGAGVSLLWRSRELRSLPRHHNLTAHITALAGGYDVDSHTSPSNPRAVVSEVSEGSFSAINAVISAGVADKRELANGLVMRTTADVSWQTLSLDDFTETGENGIVVNFDKATRFTARVGAGLEGEHWFSDIAFVHETSSGGTLSSGLRQDYRQHDGTAIEMKLGGKMADLASGLTIKAFAVWRQSVSGLAGEPSAQFELSYRF